MAGARVQERLLALAGRRVRAAMRRAYPALAAGAADTFHVARPDAVPPDPLHGVMFASPRARAVAEELGLSWGDFTHSAIGASGGGGYRTSDVRAVAAERDGRDGGGT
jgi:hypothetical protein